MRTAGGNLLVVLCGGFGAARFLPGLVSCLDRGDELCCIVNTADDIEHLGLHVSPDLDSVCYALAGRFDEDRGWGLVGDTFRCNAALARYGDDWFHIGDEDLALNLRRSALLAGGRTLSEVTRQIARAWRLPGRVLPMSDDPVRTVVWTEEGQLSFQDYVVAREARPAVRGVRYERAVGARPGPGVLDALRDADIVVFAPSNPVSSIGPILALTGVREALAARRRPTVAVTPVVQGRPPAGPAERRRATVRAALLAASGRAHNATEVAAGYADLVNGFVLDIRDQVERDRIERLGVAVALADTLARSHRDRAVVAAEILAFARRLAGMPHGRTDTEGGAGLSGSLPDPG